MNDRGLVNAGRVGGWLIKHLQHAGEVEIGVFAAKCRRSEGREVLGNDDRRGFRVPRSGSIFWIGNEGQLTWSGRFDASNARNFDVFRAVLDTSAECLSNGREFHAETIVTERRRRGR